MKDQGIFSLVIILSILITLSLEIVWILLGENCSWSLLGLRGLKRPVLASKCQFTLIGYSNSYSGAIWAQFEPKQPYWISIPVHSWTQSSPRAQISSRNNGLQLYLPQWCAVFYSPKQPQIRCWNIESLINTNENNGSNSGKRSKRHRLNSNVELNN